MKKLVFTAIAVIAFSGVALAETIAEKFVEKQSIVKIINCNDTFKAKFNLGNVTDLADSEITTLSNIITTQFDEIVNVDECTITLTAEINVGFGSVSVSVSYTAANCQTAMTKAVAALKVAVKEVRDVIGGL